MLSLAGCARPAAGNTRSDGGQQISQAPVASRKTQSARPPSRGANAGTTRPPRAAAAAARACADCGSAIADRPAAADCSDRVARRASPPLDRHLPPDIVRDEQSLHHAAVARRLLRRNVKRHGSKSAAGAGADCKGARALGQSAKPPALPVEHLDPADVPVRVRIELDLGFAGAAGCPAHRQRR